MYQLMNVGIHAFPFTFVLPVNIPSSFEGEFGHVRYSLQAVLSSSQGLCNNAARESFDVICPLDLNTAPNLAVSLFRLLGC
jgi:hypothetical protein